MGITLRKVIFWTHLVIGIAAGAIIAIMSFTGAALAFEREIIAWAERDVRKVVPTEHGKLLPLDQLLAKSKETHPDFKPTAATVFTDPTMAILLSSGRTNNLYANQYTGEVHPQSAPRLRAFMQSMIEWHRFIALAEDNRLRGKMITGASNVIFLLLAISGIYLWWPRKWTAAVLNFNFKLTGKARDFNWHNVIGIWSAPVLVVLTATAMPISYKWAGDLIYKITGTTPPPAGPGGGAGRGEGPQIELPKPPPGSQPLTLSALVESVFKTVPTAQQATVRLGGRGPVGISIKDAAAPRFTTTQLTLDPYTGAIVKKEGYAEFNAGRKIRTWTRFLHTGEALGPIGQAVAGLASLGGVVLVYTGFALAIRRFFGRKTKTAVAQAKPEPELTSVENS